MNNTKLFTVSFLATLLVISSLPLYLYLNNPESSEQIALNKFSSYEELKTFLETSSALPYNFWVRGGVTLSESGDFSVQVTTSEAAPEPSAPSEPAGSDYSKTNIQVEGVDEADIVKTDGEYIYIVSGGNITIVKAYPPEEARVLSKISLDWGITGIFINGDKLAVFETEYGIYPIYEVWDSGSSSEAVNEATPDDEPSVPEPKNGSTPVEVPPRVPAPIIWEPPTTSIKVYDISNKENPVLTRNFSIDGNYFSARMIGDYVFHEHRCPEHPERRPRANPRNNIVGRHQYDLRFTEQHLLDVPRVSYGCKRNHENSHPKNQNNKRIHNL